MTHTEILVQVQDIFRTVLKNDNLHIDDHSTAQDVTGWDSLNHMVIISQIEREFHVHFNFREIVKFQKVGDLCDAVAEKTN